METSRNNAGTGPYFLLISFFALVVPVVLYSVRFLDDNRLTSWRWVFKDTDPVRIFLLLVPVIVIAYGLSRVSLLDRSPSFLFVASFAVASLFWSEPEVIIDTARYFTQAKHLELYGAGYFFNEWGNTILAWTDMPFVPFLYGLIFRFFGEERLYIEIFTTVLFSLTVVLTCLIGRTLWDEERGYYAGLLMLGVPYLFVQVPFMMVDVPTMFFLTLTVYTFIRVLERGGAVWTVFSSVALFSVFFCKYSTWPMLSVLAVIVVVHLREYGRKVLWRALTVALLSGVLIGVVMLLKFEFFFNQIKFLFSYQVPGLKRWGESFTSTFLFQIHPFITAAALYSLYAALRKRDPKYVVTTYLLSLVVLFQLRRIRYILPLLPMLALTASYGLMEIRSRRLRRYVVFAVIGSSLVLALAVYRPFLGRYSTMNLKDAGAYLDSLDAGQVEVYTLPQKRSLVNPAVAVPILDLFTDKEITYDYEVNKGFRAPIPAKVLSTSSLRFTWLYKNPGYYMRGPERGSGAGVVVVISQRADQPLPPLVSRRLKGYRVARVFGKHTGVFRYRTIVTVYEPVHGRAGPERAAVKAGGG